MGLPACLLLKNLLANEAYENWVWIGTTDCNLDIIGQTKIKNE